MKSLTVGIDIAKLTFVAAIKDNKSYHTKELSNNEIGFSELFAWLGQYSVDSYNICMEATGIYSNALAAFAYNHGHNVYVENPAKIKHFISSQLTRNKTDVIDAKMIAYYGELFQPRPWNPTEEKTQNLQALTNRLDVLIKMSHQEKLRLESTPKIAQDSIITVLTCLNDQIQKLKKQINQYICQDENFRAKEKLLRSIPALGNITIPKIIAFLGDTQKFGNPKQMAAFIGLNPQRSQSGTSLNRSCLCKTGKSQLRKMFYMPALTAIRYNPTLKAFYNNLLSRGKPKKLAVCAVMRKLVHIIYGVLNNNQPFDPEYRNVILSKNI